MSYVFLYSNRSCRPWVLLKSSVLLFDHCSRSTDFCLLVPWLVCIVALSGSMTSLICDAPISSNWVECLEEGLWTSMVFETGLNSFVTDWCAVVVCSSSAIKAGSNGAVVSVAKLKPCFFDLNLFSISSSRIYSTSIVSSQIVLVNLTDWLIN